MQDRVEAILAETAELHRALAAQSARIAELAQKVIDAFRAGRALYVMGNGGSAADAQHLAGEMVGRFLMERAPLPCQAFTTDTSILTAIGNDYSFDEVYAKQVQAFVRRGDAVLGISTSGNAANVVQAVREAKGLGAVTLGLTGRDGGLLAAECDLALVVEADATPRIQEAHATVIHILCELIEEALFGEDDA
jgi:D-sedoheptulose 7-phosphate isomerase